MKTRVGLTPVLIALALAPTAGADETTFCNAYITTLPYTIATQGHYCFDRNLSTAITSGAAISINADFVVLDLNNFKLGGGAAGTASEAVGIHSVNRSNITIRNGNIRGFRFGIAIDGTNANLSKNNVVEHNVLDGNLTSGMEIFGVASTVRHNQVLNTGGYTGASPFCGGSNWGDGIGPYDLACTVFGGSMMTIDNAVVNTSGVNGTAINGAGQTGVMHVNNRVSGVNMSGVEYGIYGSSVGGLCRDNTVNGMTGGAAYNACTNVLSSNYP